MNKKTWEKIKYWKNKLPWPYCDLVGEEYMSDASKVSVAKRKKKEYDKKRWLNKKK